MSSLLIRFSWGSWRWWFFNWRSWSRRCCSWRGWKRRGFCGICSEWWTSHGRKDEGSE